MSNRRTKLNSAAHNDGWKFLSRRAEMENKWEQSCERPGLNSSKGASHHQRYERNRDRSSVDWPEPTFWKSERSTRIQPRSSYRIREPYSPEYERSTRSYHQSPYQGRELYSPEDKPSKGNYHPSPYQRQKSYSPENEPGARSSYHRSPYERQQSSSPKMNQTPGSYSQSSDRRLKSYVPSIGLEENENNLIWLVRKCAYMWDPKNLSFRDKKKRRETWTFIADVLGMDENECKGHWKYLRAKYSREILKLRGHTAPDFQHLMDTELIFLKPLYRNVKIVENSQSSDAERWESILKKSPNPKAFMAWIRLSMSCTQNQSDTRSSVSGHPHDRSPRRTTYKSSRTAPCSVRPSSSSSNRCSPGTASSPFSQARASTASNSSRIIREARSESGKELQELFSDIDSSGDEENYSALDAPAEMTDDEREANPSPRSNVRPASVGNESNRENPIADAIVAMIEKLPPHERDLIRSRIHSPDPNYSQDKL